jgi:hypothetical protein
VVATPAISAVPPHAHPLAGLPSHGAGAKRIDHPGHLMSGYPRVLNSRVRPLLGEGIAVADAARLYPDPDRSGARLGYLPLNGLEGPVRAGDLYHAHRCHDFSQARSVFPGSPAEWLRSAD